MDIGKRIKYLRKDVYDMTLEELESKSGVSRAFISAIERNEKTPTIEKLEQLATGFGLSVINLLSNNTFEKENIILVMGDMSKDEFIKDVREKTKNVAFTNKLLNILLDGTINPTIETINFLSKYARVSNEFWFRLNTKETLENERSQYLLTHTQEPQTASTLFPATYSPTIVDFITNEANLEYLSFAMLLAERKINCSLIENIIFAEKKKT